MYFNTFGDARLFCEMQLPTYLPSLKSYWTVFIYLFILLVFFSALDVNPETAWEEKNKKPCRRTNE